MPFKELDEIRDGLSGQLRSDAHGFAWDGLLENARLEARKDLLGLFLAHGLSAADALTHASAWADLAQEHQTRTEYWLVVKGLIHKTEGRHGLLQDYADAWERTAANVAAYLATIDDLDVVGSAAGGTLDGVGHYAVPASCFRRLRPTETPLTAAPED